MVLIEIVICLYALSVLILQAWRWSFNMVRL